MSLRTSPSEDHDASLLSGIRHDTAMAIGHLLGAGLHAGKAGTKGILRTVRAFGHVIRRAIR